MFFMKVCETTEIIESCVTEFLEDGWKYRNTETGEDINHYPFLKLSIKDWTVSKYLVLNEKKVTDYLFFDKMLVYLIDKKLHPEKETHVWGGHILGEIYECIYPGGVLKNNPFLELD